MDKTDYNHDERKVYTNDDETEDYPYKNDISEYTDDFGNDYDYSDTSVHGCPGIYHLSNFEILLLTFGKARV